MKKLRRFHSSTMMSDELVIEAIEDEELRPRKPQKSTRKTSPYVNKYEYTALLAKRTLQIMVGEPPTIDTHGMVDPMEIALKEMHDRKIPLVIERILPTGEIENWDPNKMNLLNH